MVWNVAKKYIFCRAIQRRTRDRMRSRLTSFHRVKYAVYKQFAAAAATTTGLFSDYTDVMTMETCFTMFAYFL